jgi:hypothetical protein
MLCPSITINQFTDGHLPFTFIEKENLNICSASLESYTSNYINAYVDYILSETGVKTGKDDNFECGYLESLWVPREG